MPGETGQRSLAHMRDFPGQQRDCGLWDQSEQLLPSFGVLNQKYSQLNDRDTGPIPEGSVGVT